MSVQQQIDKLIAIRASELFERIRTGEVEVSSEEFRRWISESPKHVDAFMTIAGQAPFIREVLQSRQVEWQQLLNKKGSGVVRLDSLSPRPESTTPERPARRASSVWKSRVAWASLAASLAIVALVLWLAPDKWQRLQAGAGEQRTVTLSDGSIVSLNAESRVEVRLRQRERDLRLLRGEAIFKVAHDATRPFNVRTPSAVVKAVGTEFAVSIRNESTTVTVLEGKVEVASGVQPPAPPASASSKVDSASEKEPVRFAALSAGQAARVARSGAVEFEPHADVATSIAWLQRKLVFRGTFLEDMVIEFNRYNRGVQLHIENVTPGAYRFSGTFDANDPLSLADLLGREPGLSVERRGNDIYIRGNEPTP
jgi:transmembrane sensor